MPSAALAKGKPESRGFEASLPKSYCPLLLAKLLCGLKLFCQNAPTLMVCWLAIFDKLTDQSRFVLKLVKGELFEPMFGPLATRPVVPQELLPKQKRGGELICTAFG